MTVELCDYARFGTGVQGKCLGGLSIAPSPSFLVMSSIYNISVASGVYAQEPFTFTLPFFPSLLSKTQQTRDCYSTKLSCEKYNFASSSFEQTGCTLQAQNVNMDVRDNIVGALCTCDHLTSVAVLLRYEPNTNMCGKESSDYIMLALFGMLGLVLLFECFWFAYRNRRLGLLLCLILFGVVLCRIILLAKASLSIFSAAFLTLVPSAVCFALFLYLLIHWQVLFAMTLHPFAKFRAFCIVALVCILVAVVANSIAVGVSSDVSSSIFIAKIGSYFLPVISGSVCLLILASVRELRSTSADYVTESSLNIRFRSCHRWTVLGFTVCVSWYIFIASCLCVKIVEGLPLVRNSVAFLVVDLLLVCTLGSLLAITNQKNIQDSGRVQLESS